MKRPDYYLQKKCKNLSWDKNLNEWYCRSTHICFRDISSCPLVDALTIEVSKGRFNLKNISPLSFRNAVENSLKIFEIQLSLFDE